MRAAEAVFAALAAGREGHDEPAAYAEAFRGSWVHNELYAARNSRPAFRWGLLAGTVYRGIDLWPRGRTPWTLRHRAPDHATLRQAPATTPIASHNQYGVHTVDRPPSVSRSHQTRITTRKDRG